MLKGYMSIEIKIPPRKLESWTVLVKVISVSLWISNFLMYRHSCSWAKK